MGFFRKYMVFVYAIATITLVTCDDDDNSQFYNELLKLFNFARVLHGAEPLILDLELCQEAMNYLNNLAHSSLSIFDNIRYYNLVVPTGIERTTPRRIFFSLYKWGKFYKYDIEDKYGNAGSFTSLLWKETKLVGFGLLYKDQTNYFSAIYRPIVEKKGKQIQNVGEPRDIEIFKRFNEFIDD